MLLQVVEEKGRNRNHLLLYILSHPIRETLQASQGFINFELLFGRWTQPLLDMVNEAWEKQLS